MAAKNWLDVLRTMHDQIRILVFKCIVLMSIWSRKLDIFDKFSKWPTLQHGHQISFKYTHFDKKKEEDRTSSRWLPTNLSPYTTSELDMIKS